MTKEKVNSIEDFKVHIEQSIKIDSEGRNFAQQSLENYITETLDMVVVKVESLGDKHTINESFKITAKSKKEGFDSEYIFISDYYDSSWFTSRENALYLKGIKGEEGSHEIDEIFYLTSMREESNRNHRLLTTPLSKLLSGEIEDEEVDFVVKYLKKTFEGKFGCEYTEESKGNQSTFRIRFNNEIVIGIGFSNTVQVSFKNKGFRSIQFIFREVSKEKIKREIDKIYLIIESYFDWNIIVDEKHNLSNLHDFLSSKNYLVDVNTNALVENKMTDYTVLFYNFVIGEYSSYKQFDITIAYSADKGNFKISINYLFKKAECLCNTVNDVKSKLEEIGSWIS